MVLKNLERERKNSTIKFLLEFCIPWSFPWEEKKVLLFPPFPTTPLPPSYD
jgi:hypothetical protein